MKLYHITKTANVASIMSEGLQPCKSRDGLSGGMYYSRWREEVVWMTDDIEYIIDCQCGYSWAEDATVLEVDVSDLDLVHREGCFAGHEWVHYGSIPPERLNVIESKKWTEFKSDYAVVGTYKSQPRDEFP